MTKEIFFSASPRIRKYCGWIPG